MSFAKTNNWNKRREIQTPCHCTGWKKRTPAIWQQSWIWAKRKQQTEHKSTDPTETDELSVCAVVLPYTSTVCATEKNKKRKKKWKKKQGVRIWRLWMRTAQTAFPMQIAQYKISTNASYPPCLATKKKKKKEGVERERGRCPRIFSHTRETAWNSQQFCALRFTNMWYNLGETKYSVPNTQPH